MTGQRQPAAIKVSALSETGTADVLYRGHHAWLLQVIRKRFGSDQAEDFAQETFLRAFVYQEKPISRPRALLIQIATRVVIDAVRKSSVRPPVHDSSAELLSCPADQEESVALKQAITSLPFHLRQTFLLSRIAGLTYDEIADQSGISVKTVEWRVSKALRILAAVRTEAKLGN